MDSYKRIKELLAEGSLGFMRGERMAKGRNKARGKFPNKHSNLANSYADHMRKRSEKKYSKRSGEGSLPKGRTPGDIDKI